MDNTEDKASKKKKSEAIGFGFYFRHRWNFIQSLYMVFTWIVLVRLLCRRPFYIGQNHFLLSGMPSGVGGADDGHLSVEHAGDLLRDGFRVGHAIVRILHRQHVRGSGFARCPTPFGTSVDHRLFLRLFR